jgi:DNA replication protein DnaC
MEAQYMPQKKENDDTNEKDASFLLTECQASKYLGYTPRTLQAWRMENLLSLGPPGVGKSHIASGLGVKAAENGFAVVFMNAEITIASGYPLAGCSPARTASVSPGD